MKHAQLWKRILNEGIFLPEDVVPKGDDDYKNQVVNRIIKCPIIVDPVIQPLGEFNYNFAKYRNLSIPFENFWVEGVFSNGGRWGSKVSVIKNTELLSDEYRKLGVTSDMWILQIFAFMGIAGESVHSIGKIWCFVDRGGNLLGSDSDSVVFTNLLSHTLRPEEFVEGRGIDVRDEAGRQTIQMVCDVLLFLGCKNIFLKESPLEKKDVIRAAKRCGGTPDSYRYHTLVVRPPGAKSDTPAQDIGIMPRHVCRGHFSEYGPEFGKGLLFGKYSGRFYIPPHVKGDKKNGIVEKDYEVR